MTNPFFREALLKQNGGASIEAELNTLHGIIQAEQRRARRLTLATIAVWAIWFSLIGLYLAVPIIAKSNGPHGPPLQPTSQPATIPAAAHPDSMPAAVFKGFVALLIVVSFLCLPAIGIILLIMMILARRSASLNQVRASLASIDAQLRLLAMAPRPPAAPQA